MRRRTEVKPRNAVGIAVRVVDDYGIEVCGTERYTRGDWRATAFARVQELRRVFPDHTIQWNELYD